MSLNIKNERVHELVREVARRTGSTQTSALEQALERMLADLDRQQGATGRRARVDAILADIDLRLSDRDRALVTTDDLYDPATGMPR